MIGQDWWQNKALFTVGIF